MNDVTRSDALVEYVGKAGQQSRGASAVYCVVNKLIISRD